MPAPPPTGGVLRKERSLGTMAMANRDGPAHGLGLYASSSYSSSSSDVGDGLKLNEAQPLPPPPPVPTAPVQFLDKRKRVKVREAPYAVGELPRIIPPPPPIPDDSHPPSPGSRSPLSPLLARVASKRKTIMDYIDGWWDLGLLEKRQTLLGRNGSGGSKKG